METNLANKKKYNVVLMLAGICFTLFAVGKIASEVIDFLYFLFNPNLREWQNFGLYNPILSIIPIILLGLIFIFCLFMFIGKPKVLFSIFFILMSIFYLYFTIINIIHICMSVYYANEPIISIYIFVIIYKIFASISALTIVISFVVAFIISLISLFKKKAVKIWFVPGIIITFGYIFDLITQIIWFNWLSIMRIIADITNTYPPTAHLYVYLNAGGASTNITAVISIIAGIFLVIGAFLIGKGTNK